MYRRKDAFYRSAKAAGYRSRAAYKLIEANRRYRLIGAGDRVLDLGAWPGGWMQVAAAVAGAGGRVVGVDLRPIEALSQPWVSVITGDVHDENVQSRIAEALGGPADIIVSDMAPKLSGVRDRDEAEATELTMLALAAARRFLRPGGRTFVKLFTSAASRTVMAEFERHFANVKIVRPEATRKGSSEVYVVAKGFRHGVV